MKPIGFDMDGGMFPRLWCKDCGKLIEFSVPDNGDDPKVLWNEQGELAFMHRDCDDDSYEYWEPLHTFFRHLLHNTRMTSKKLKETDVFERHFGCTSKPRKARQR